MGVRRALDIVEKTLRENPRVPVYTLGPLIHNGRVVEEFRARGVIPIEDVARASGGIVVIRAHGIGPGQKKEIESRGLRLIDATCPHVRRVQERVRRSAERGAHVVIVGDAGHGEVKGIRGYAGASTVLSTPEEAEIIELPSPCIVVSQTTFKRAEYGRICRVLESRRPDIEVFETSCESTETRQEGLLKLAEKVDAILVIGGKSSANTRWLYQTAVQTGKPSWHIEGAADIPRGIGRYAVAGISAGASTPDAVIEEVENRLRAL
jgi:4-hydroxy-3-methylbut-2-enyl diphosphate reductase